MLRNWPWGVGVTGIPFLNESKTMHNTQRGSCGTEEEKGMDGFDRVVVLGPLEAEQSIT